jgi:hypothetical protein
MLKAVLVALAATAAMTTAALAECRIMAFTFHLSQQDTVSTTGVSTRGSGCVTRLHSGATSAFKSASVASSPGHGTLSEVGTTRITYRPTRGFKGTDRFGVRICGTDRAGSGCSTINYAITVE